MRYQLQAGVNFSELSFDIKHKVFGESMDVEANLCAAKPITPDVINRFYFAFKYLDMHSCTFVMRKVAYRS